MEYEWHDILGNIGVILILVTYLLLQLERLQATDFLYSTLNGLGAGLVLISLTINFNMSAFIIEVAWLIISIFGIVLYMLRKSPGRPDKNSA